MKNAEKNAYLGKYANSEICEMEKHATLAHSFSERFARLGHHHLADDKHSALDPIHCLDLFEHVAHCCCCCLLLVHEENHAGVARRVVHGEVQRFPAGKVEAGFKMIEVAVPDEGVTQGKGGDDTARSHMTGTL